MNKIKIIIEPLYNKLRDKCIEWFYYLPFKKNKIVFIQSFGGGYKCNLKYIADEIIKQNLCYDLVWLVDKMDYDIPAPIRKVKYNRIRAVYELATCKVLINNSKSLYPLKKKSGQTFIYVPHGQPGCKCAEGDAVLPEIWIRNSKQHSALTDVFVSMSKYHTQVLKETFWVPENAEIWETGFPRNDNYYKDTTEKQKEIRGRLGVPDGFKIAFYAPTFRDNNSTEAYDIDFHRVLDTLEEKTGDKWIFFVTLHGNFIWFKKPPYKFDERVWNMSSYPDIHELLLIADIAISDYSSTALDFSHTRRPVFLYASDIDEYTKMRGLKEMYFRLPFSLAKNNDELVLNILNYNHDEYIKRYEDFMKIEYGNIDDGYASKRFVSYLFTIFK